ncbi:orf4 [Artaxa digramma nucleopolyhedrovirus]|uniref:Orf4 n=1 Tax=Artaxa digramma nucleopolyhedrovirus TaxID=3070910 RepID=A0AAE6R7E2_9ABAC|nr:orf4 [Euproctis digramma nucleopolyhedrovirus]QHB21663.1 orf4 [Artaxa digramma nucleopolyhedrovirus]
MTSKYILHYLKNINNPHELIKCSFDNVTRKFTMYLKVQNKYIPCGVYEEDSNKFKIQRVTYKNRCNFTTIFEKLASYINCISKDLVLRVELQNYVTIGTKICVLELYMFSMKHYVKHNTSALSIEKPLNSMYSLYTNMRRTMSREEVALAAVEIYDQNLKSNDEFSYDDLGPQNKMMYVSLITNSVYNAVQELYDNYTKKLHKMQKKFANDINFNYHLLLLNKCNRCNVERVTYSRDTCHHLLCILCMYKNIHEEECIICKMNQQQQQLPIFSRLKRMRGKDKNNSNLKNLTDDDSNSNDSKNKRQLVYSSEQSCSNESYISKIINNDDNACDENLDLASNDNNKNNNNNSVDPLLPNNIQKQKTNENSNAQFDNSNDKKLKKCINEVIKKIIICQNDKNNTPAAQTLLQSEEQSQAESQQSESQIQPDSLPPSCSNSVQNEINAAVASISTKNDTNINIGSQTAQEFLNSNVSSESSSSFNVSFNDNSNVIISNSVERNSLVYDNSIQQKRRKVNFNKNAIVTNNNFNIIDVKMETIEDDELPLNDDEQYEIAEEIVIKNECIIDDDDDVQIIDDCRQRVNYLDKNDEDVQIVNDDPAVVIKPCGTFSTTLCTNSEGKFIFKRDANNKIIRKRKFTSAYDPIKKL